MHFLYQARQESESNERKYRGVVKHFTRLKYQKENFVSTLAKSIKIHKCLLVEGVPSTEHIDCRNIYNSQKIDFGSFDLDIL